MFKFNLYIWFRLYCDAKKSYIWGGCVCTNKVTLRLERGNVAKGPAWPSDDERWRQTQQSKDGIKICWTRDVQKLSMNNFRLIAPECRHKNAHEINYSQITSHRCFVRWWTRIMIGNNTVGASFRGCFSVCVCACVRARVCMWSVTGTTRFH